MASSMMMMTTKKRKNPPQSSLPPGFRFHPTDEELILHYLQKKVASIPFPVSIIADVDIYKFDPWDLPGKATFGEKEWYFFSPRDRKYPNGARPNRAAASGYWKATGTDKIISVPSVGRGQIEHNSNTTTTNVGVKKALVFYKGRPPKGIKTNWIMHEYRLADAPSVKPMIRPLNKDSSMRLDDWVLCRIYKKSQPNLSHQSEPPTTSSAVLSSSDHDREEEEEEEDEEKFVQQTLLPLSTSSKTTTTTPPLMSHKSSSFSNLLDATDYTLLSSFLSDPQFSFNVAPPPGSGPNDSNFAFVVNQHQQQHQQQQQSLFGSMSSNGGYLHHKLPNLQYPGGTGTTSATSASYAGETTMINQRPKRERSNGDDDDDHVMMMMMNPSKKSMNSCNHFTNNNHNHINNNNNHGGNGNNGTPTTSFDDYVAPTNGFLNQTLLNQQLLLSHHLQFQG